MNINMFIALSFLICLVASKTIPNMPQANPSCTTAFCINCEVPATCDACDGQYYLNANICTSCISAIPNCVNCTYNVVVPQVECFRCDVGYYSQGPQACKLCSDDVTNCLTCTNDGTTTTCSDCFVSYFLSAPNTCTLCDGGAPHCF